jgi:predicted RNase H-like HicB family nuclease
MEESSIQLTVELIPDEEQVGFTACIPDIPAYGEGYTEAAAIEDLKEALRIYLEIYIEARGIDQAILLVRPPAVVRQLEVDLAELIRGSAPSRQRQGNAVFAGT